MLTIGFAGTAKNTGKTTAALHFLALCDQRGLPAALTSIGYDGENLDNVTGLPKPRYHVKPGTFVATASQCLAAGSARYRHVSDTGIHTVLGEVILAEVTRPGSVVLAGPNRGRDITTLLELFRRHAAAVAFLDGALNRLVPLAVADGLVLSTGAAFDERISVTAAHAGGAAALFRLPIEPDNQACALSSAALVQAPGKPAQALSTGSLLSSQALQTLLAALPTRAARLVLPGACAPRFFESLLAEAHTSLAGCHFVFSSPFHLLASGDPLHWQHILAGMAASGQTAAYALSVPLRLVTVNPFFPRYLSTGRYKAEYVDKDLLRRQVQAQVEPFPVENIRQPVRLDLLSLFDL